MNAIAASLASEIWGFLYSRNLGAFVHVSLVLWLVSWIAGAGAVWLAGHRLDNFLCRALAAPTGLAITAASWASLISLGVAPTSPWLLAVPLGLACAGWWSRPSASDAPRSSAAIEWVVLVLVWAIAFGVCANLVKNNFVYPGADSQTTAYFGWLMERESAYPFVHPFPAPAEATLSIDYPPAFEVLYVALGRFLGAPLEVRQMATAVAISTLFSVAVAGLAFEVTGSIWWAFWGGVASLARGFLFQTVTGNATEILAMASMAPALGWVALGARRWNPRAAVLVGSCCASAILSNGKVFELYFLTLTIVALFWIATRHGQRLAVMRWSAAAMFSCALVLAPWAWHSLANLHLVGGSTHVYTHPVVHWWRNVARWNESWILLAASVGAIGAFAYGPLVARILGLQIFVCLAVAQYWLLLYLWSPAWFSLKRVPFDEWTGTDLVFKTKLLYPYPIEIGFIGYTIAFPVLAALAGLVFERALAAVGRRVSGDRAGFALGWLGAIAGASLLSCAPRTTSPSEAFASQLMSEADYRVLKWMDTHTERERTLLLNPWHLSRSMQGNWAAVVSNRATVFFRGADQVFNSWVGQPPYMEDLKAAYLDPEAPDSIARMGDAGVTHVFVPTVLAADLVPAYERSEGARKVATESSEGGSAAIFEITPPTPASDAGETEP